MIIHVDMDAFYASVEQRDNPELRGRPVIVGGRPGTRGVVSAASYEARRFGVRSAMPLVTAQRLCPDGVFLPVRMDAYAEVSDRIREIFYRYTPLIEPISLDEAFLDVTGSVALFGPEPRIATEIKQAIRDELHLTASAGVAPNKFLAKIASDLRKPDGLVIVDPDHVQEFLDPLPVERIWGVGKVTARVFERLRVRTIGQLRQLSPATLQSHFGQASAEHLWHLARGLDQRAVVPDVEAKSISHETTFLEDVDDREVLRSVLLNLTDQVARRLRRHERFARSVHLKVRFADFKTITRSHTLETATNVTQELADVALDMFESRLPRPLPPVRLIGMGVGHLTERVVRQRTLFDTEESSHQRQSSLDRMTDLIRDTFGKHAVQRGSSLEGEECDGAEEE